MQWEITTKFRGHPQTYIIYFLCELTTVSAYSVDLSCSLGLFSLNTITFQKYFWYSQFSESDYHLGGFHKSGDVYQERHHFALDSSPPLCPISL